MLTFTSPTDQRTVEAHLKQRRLALVESLVETESDRTRGRIHEIDVMLSLLGDGSGKIIPEIASPDYDQ